VSKSVYSLFDRIIPNGVVSTTITSDHKLRPISSTMKKCEMNTFSQSSTIVNEYFVYNQWLKLGYFHDLGDSEIHGIQVPHPSQSTLYYRSARNCPQLDCPLYQK